MGQLGAPAWHIRCMERAEAPEAATDAVMRPRFEHGVTTESFVCEARHERGGCSGRDQLVRERPLAHLLGTYDAWSEQRRQRQPQTRLCDRDATEIRTEQRGDRREPRMLRREQRRVSRADQ